jgi:HAE1 family hydrophobic/amphiphilic exporter-1
MLGIIMLVGLVGKNAILLVDRTNQMRREKGLSVHDALLEAAQTRLRPIIMTTASMVVGMSPIAFSLSAGSEFKSGLAWALIGGLVSSLLLTLVLVPVVYSKVDQWRVAIMNLGSPLTARNPDYIPEKSDPVRNRGEREAPPLPVGTH